MDSFFETLKNLGAGRLAFVLLTFFALAIFFIFIAARSSAPGMTLLYANLTGSDATEIVSKLDSARIPYTLSDDGTKVSVPQKEVGRARILLAQEGLPHQGSIGYEIFDQKQSFGTTAFVQNINQVRALEGELSRTVSAMEAVRSARVQIVLPQRELFSRESSPARASVFVNLRNAAAFGREQIQAVQHLVAAAVPRLKATNVAVIDQNGNLLASGEEGEPDAATARNTEELRQKYEGRITRSLEDMLGRVVGYGKVRVAVTTDMNFDVINRSSESYNPDEQVVRSAQTSNEENSESSSAAGGTTSVENNLPGIAGASGSGGAGGGNKNSKTEEVTNYEIGKTIENIIRANGQVQKVSVAVLVDGRYETDASATPPKDAPKDWVAPKKYVPRDQAELDKIASLVKSAIGYDESRGDKIEVVNMQFIEEFVPDVTLDDANKMFGFQKADLLGMAETLTLSVVAILVILLVLKPLAQHMIASSARANRASETTAAEEAALLTGGGAPAQLAPPGSEERSELENMIDISQVEGKVKASSVQKITELVNSHPGETVSVIRSWMSQEGQ